MDVEDQSAVGSLTLPSATGPLPALEIRAAALERIDRAALRGYPYEVCGLLLGRRAGRAVQVVRAVKLRNLAVDRRRDRFVLDPEGFVRVDAEVRRVGLDIVGVWHTHPDSPARPSATDRHWGWPSFTYLILRVGSEGIHERRSWELNGDGFAEQAVQMMAQLDPDGAETPEQDREDDPWRR